MVKCESCGADNQAGRARCEYCDSPLKGSVAISVAWKARTNEGTQAHGRIEVQAPAGTSSDKVHSLVQAAFSATVDETGEYAADAEVEETLERCVRAVLPESYELVGLSLGGFDPATLVEIPDAGGATELGEVAGKAGRGAAGVCLLLGLLTSSSCCLFFALGGYVAGGKHHEQAELVGHSTVAKPDESIGVEGTVCVEAATARVDSALLVPIGEGIPALYYETSFHRQGSGSGQGSGERPDDEEEMLARLWLGKLEVSLIDGTTDVDGAADLGKVDVPGGRVEYAGIRVTQPVTVVGEVRDGVLQARVVSTRASREDLIAHFESKASTDRWMGIASGVLGVLLLLAFLLLAAGTLRK